MKANRGVTMIEMMISTAIIAVVGGIMIYALHQSNQAYQVQKTEAVTAEDAHSRIATLKLDARLAAVESIDIPPGTSGLPPQTYELRWREVLGYDTGDVDKDGNRDEFILSTNVKQLSIERDDAVNGLDFDGDGVIDTGRLVFRELDPRIYAKTLMNEGQLAYRTQEEATILHNLLFVSMEVDGGIWNSCYFQRDRKARVVRIHLTTIEISPDNPEDFHVALAEAKLPLYFLTEEARPATSPLAVTASASSTWIEIRWTDIYNDEDEWQVERVSDRGFGEAILPSMTGSGSSMYYTFSGGLPGATYYFRVRAIRNGKPEDWSRIVNATIDAGISPVANLVLSGKEGPTTGTELLQWNDPFIDSNEAYWLIEMFRDRGGQIEYFQCPASAGVTTTTATAPTTTTTPLSEPGQPGMWGGPSSPNPGVTTTTAPPLEYLVTGLKDGYSYQFRVRAIIPRGHMSRWSNTYNVRRYGGKPPPIQLSAMKLTGTTVSLNWTATSPAGGPFSVFYRKMGSDGEASGTNEALGSWTFSGPAPTTTAIVTVPTTGKYEFYVVDVHGIGSDVVMVDVN